MVQKALTYNATMHRLKPFFPNCYYFVLKSYLTGILFRIMVFLVMGRSPENVKEKEKTDKINIEK